MSINSHNVNINAINEDDRTALHKAAYNGNPEIIELLLKYGADPRLIDSSGHTAIDCIDHTECRIIMMKWKTEWTDSILKTRVEAQDKMANDFIEMGELTREMKEKLRQFLIDKAKEGNFQKIQQIVSLGKASIETRDNHGSSLLSIAVSKGHYQ